MQECICIRTLVFSILFILVCLAVDDSDDVCLCICIFLFVSLPKIFSCFLQLRLFLVAQNSCDFPSIFLPASKGHFDINLLPRFTFIVKISLFFGKQTYHQGRPSKMADEEVCLRNTGKVKRRQRRPERRCFYVAGCLFLLLLFAAFGVLIALLLVVGWQEPRVATTSGVIDGLFDPDFHLFSFRASFSDHFL